MRSKLLATTIAATVGAVIWAQGALAQAANESPQANKEVSQENRSAAKGTTGKMERTKQGETGQTGHAQSAPEPPMRPRNNESMKSPAGAAADAGEKTDENARPAMGDREEKHARDAAAPDERGRMPGAAPTTHERREGVTVSGDVHISQENASRVAEAPMSTAPEQNANVNVEAGALLPGNLELRALPTAVVSLVPEYRGFEYVVAGNEILFVQPSTRKVVEIIRQDRMAQAPENPDHRTRLSLSDAQRRMLLDSVRGEKLPEAQIAELSDGETIPQDIELEPLPSTIVVQIPTIEHYRVLMVPGDRVVLVDPQTRAVIDIVE